MHSSSVIYLHMEKNRIIIHLCSGKTNPNFIQWKLNHKENLLLLVWTNMLKQKELERQDLEMYCLTHLVKANNP